MSIEMRMKYGKGITSQDFIETGIPRLKKRQGNNREANHDYLSIDADNTRIAIRNSRQWKAKRKGPEYKIFFE